MIFCIQHFDNFYYSIYSLLKIENKDISVVRPCLTHLWGLEKCDTISYSKIQPFIITAIILPTISRHKPHRALRLFELMMYGNDRGYNYN
jgi:hypothetical protein